MSQPTTSSPEPSEPSKPSKFAQLLDRHAWRSWGEQVDNAPTTQEVERLIEVETDPVALMEAALQQFSTGEFLYPHLGEKLLRRLAALEPESERVKWLLGNWLSMHALGYEEADRLLAQVKDPAIRDTPLHLWPNQP